MPATYCMSKYYAPIVEKLLETTNRPDGNQNNLRSAAYEAIMEMIKNSPAGKFRFVFIPSSTLGAKQIQSSKIVNDHFYCRLLEHRIEGLFSQRCNNIRKLLLSETSDNNLN